VSAGAGRQTGRPMTLGDVRMDRFVVISGCSGGGKSTLLAELRRRGYAVTEEPGRRIVAEEMTGGGSALPWVDMAAFARRTMALALADRDCANTMDGWVFFDRGLIDAACSLQYQTGELVLDRPCQKHRYHQCVFLAPPWPEIYVIDSQRMHGQYAALAEYARLLEVYPSLGYEVVVLPKAGVAERVDFILKSL
jgi:predicted ATPase